MKQWMKIMAEKRKQPEHPDQSMLFKGMERPEAQAQQPQSAAPERRRIIPVHRQGFGIIAVHVSELLDKGTGDLSKGEKCDHFCHLGTRWVHHGLMNIRFTLNGSSQVRLPEIHDSVFDLLNEAEIYALLAKVWLGKFFRDEKKQDELLPDRIDSMKFPELMAALVQEGKSMLTNHWNYAKLYGDNRLNPYPSTYGDLVERFELVPDAHHNAVREVLKAKIIQPEVRGRGVYRPGFQCEKDMWKEDPDGRHVKRKEAPPEVARRGQFDDERAYASTVRGYFNQKDVTWFYWRDSYGEVNVVMEGEERK